MGLDAGFSFGSMSGFSLNIDSGSDSDSDGRLATEQTEGEKDVETGELSM